MAEPVVLEEDLQLCPRDPPVAVGVYAPVQDLEKIAEDDALVSRVGQLLGPVHDASLLKRAFLEQRIHKVEQALVLSLLGVHHERSGTRENRRVCRVPSGWRDHSGACYCWVGCEHVL